MKRFWLLLAMAALVAGCNQGDDLTSIQSRPTISSMTPSQVFRGQTVNDARIVGTNFSGILVVNLGDGVEVREIKGVTPTEISIRFFVNLDAQPGPRAISINTAGGTGTLASGINVGGNRVPIANFTFDPPTGISATSFNFNGTSSSDPDGRISNYQWDFGDGGSATGSVTSHKFSRPGSFMVKLTVTDNEQASGNASKELPVKDGSLPVPRFSVSPNNGDTDTKFVFDASESEDRDGRIVDYRWNMGDGSRKSGKVVQYKFRASGRFMVQLITSDDDGLTAFIEKQVEIRGSAPVANFVIDPEVGDTTTVFRFDASSSFDQDGFITGYSWTFGDGGSSGGEVAQHQFSTAGTYPIKLTVVDNNGKLASKERSFRVFNPDGGGDDDDDDDDGGAGRCTTPSRQRVPYFFRVISADAGSRVIVGEFFEDVECSDVFYLCGDVRIGGIGGAKEYWIGAICEMSDLGNNRFEIHLVQGTSWPDIGETGTYVWPQLDCNPAVTCR